MTIVLLCLLLRDQIRFLPFRFCRILFSRLSGRVVEKYCVGLEGVPIKCHEQASLAHFIFCFEFFFLFMLFTFEQKKSQKNHKKITNQERVKEFVLIFYFQ